uniref:Uncharacterized protein n=1 Tax=Rhizophora mucronata TaxID=61149 RepID=A0A2P2Q9C8_RHIMU
MISILYFNVTYIVTLFLLHCCCTILKVGKIFLISLSTYVSSV